jgi:hypothetical protein
MNSQLSMFLRQDSGANSTCAELMSLAERELNSFVVAITDMFGSEEAFVSAEEWLQELSSTRLRCPPAKHALRLITISASIRLADRRVQNAHASSVALRAEAA